MVGSKAPEFMVYENGYCFKRWRIKGWSGQTVIGGERRGGHWEDVTLRKRKTDYAEQRGENPTTLPPDEENDSEGEGEGDTTISTPAATGAEEPEEEEPTGAPTGALPTNKSSQSEVLLETSRGVEESRSRSFELSASSFLEVSHLAELLSHLEETQGGVVGESWEDKLWDGSAGVLDADAIEKAVTPADEDRYRDADSLSQQSTEAPASDDIVDGSSLCIFYTKNLERRGARLLAPPNEQGHLPSQIGLPKCLSKNL